MKEQPHLVILSHLEYNGRKKRVAKGVLGETYNNTVGYEVLYACLWLRLNDACESV